MTKRAAPILALCLIVAATAAHAQYGGGAGGGAAGGRHGGGGRSPSPSSKPAAAPAPAAAAVKPVSSIEIIGVIKAIDPATDRITIAYEDVQALSWPAGTMPFTVSKTALLKSASVGEKVRFKLDSQQISELTPY